MTKRLATMFALTMFALMMCARADSLTLRSGLTVSGKWISIDPAQISFMIDGVVQTYPRSDVAKVVFGAQAPPVMSQSTPAASAPKTVKAGQTGEEVMAALGQPSTVLDLGAKKILVYPNLKVTLVDGKVTDVE